MSSVDVLIITALPLEYEAARDAALASTAASHGVDTWTACEENDNYPYLRGVYRTEAGNSISLALARPTRMGANGTLPIASALVERLKPACLAMSGVCAGNPGDMALGDVIIAEMAYQYDEGKRAVNGFVGDHRQYAMPDVWLRRAQDLTPTGLPSHGAPSDDETVLWVLERLHAGEDPLTHPARARYLPDQRRGEILRKCVSDELIRRAGLTFELTAGGRALVEENLAYDSRPPVRLPFEVRVGPMASGNVVVKDGITWNSLAQHGVRSALGLEMEAAAIASLAHRAGLQHWVVAKAVMDHADPRKDDRYKPFAARASAEVLYRFLSQVSPLMQGARDRSRTPQAASEWPATPPALQWNIADQRDIHDLVAAMLTRNPQSRLLMLRGESGMGKSAITTQVLKGALTVPGLIASRFDFKGSAGLDREFDAMVAVLDLDREVESGPLAQRFGRLLSKLEARQAPTLLIFDTYEAAAGDTVEWMEKVLLAKLLKSSWLRVLVAGQRVPTSRGAIWENVAYPTYVVQPPRPEDWHAYGQAHRNDVEDLDFAIRAHKAAAGKPAFLVGFFGPRE